MEDAPEISRQPMHPHLMRLHQSQVLHQCRAALIHLELAQRGLRADDEQETFWAGVQAALTATANISKSLWGSGGKGPAERRDLRQSLGVQDDSPLASTDLRNHLEHFEERLDRWFARSRKKNNIDYAIGPASMIDAEPTDIFRHFDPDTGDVIFWGEHYSLTELGDALRLLLPVVEREASRFD